MRAREGEGERKAVVSLKNLVSTMEANLTVIEYLYFKLELRKNVVQSYKKLNAHMCYANTKIIFEIVTERH